MHMSSFWHFERRDMLNNDKIKLMTEISLYEKQIGKQSFNIKDYFKEDYISKAMIKSFFGFSFCFILILAIELLYSIQIMLNIVNVLDVLNIFIGFILQYIIGLFIYELITWYISKKRYEKAVKAYAVYIAKIKILYKKYDSDVKQGGTK